jgi:hypothetical protein
MIRVSAGAILPLLLMLPACSGGDDLPDGNQSGPVRVAGTRVDSRESAGLLGTPMAQRVAVIGLLNKRNGLTRDLTMKPGEALRVGDAIVRLQACEVTAPWENTPEVGAFIQLDVRSPADGKWRRNFSGWLFKERPERNVVQHPIYDIWVKSCTMSWPETGPDTVKLGDKTGSGAISSRGDASNAVSDEETGAPAPDAAAPAPGTSPPRPAANGAPSTARPSNTR